MEIESIDLCGSTTVELEVDVEFLLKAADVKDVAFEPTSIELTSKSIRMHVQSDR